MAVTRTSPRPPRAIACALIAHLLERQGARPVPQPCSGPADQSPHPMRRFENCRSDRAVGGGESGGATHRRTDARRAVYDRDPAVVRVLAAGVTARRRPVLGVRGRRAAAAPAPAD